MNLTIKERIDIIKTGSTPDGYKRCKTGTIPKDWDEKRIVEICNVNKQSLNGSTPKDYLFNYYDLSSIDNGKIMHPPNQIRFEEAPSRARRIFKKNDILMSTVRPYLKGFAYIDFDCRDCIASTGFAILESKNDKDAMLIYHNLFSYAIDKQINSLLVGSNYPAINSSDVENLKIPYAHNACEREIIGNILTTCDKAIKLKEKLIDEKKKQKTGLMQKLLTGKVRLPSFIGEWKEVKLGKVIREINDKTTENNQYQVLTSSRQGIFLQEEYFNKSVASSNNIGYKIIKKGQFTYRTMSDDGSFKFNRLVEYEEGIVSPAYVVFETTKINPVFLMNLMNDYSFNKHIQKETQGGTRLSLKYNSLKEFVIKIPSIEEQDAIANVLNIVDKVIELNQKELEKIKLQKKGLMQLLLTGIVRVNTQES